MEHYAIVDDATLVVVNTTVWDGVSDWAPPAGQTAVLDAEHVAYIGDTYDPDDGTFTRPPAPVDPAAPTPTDLQIIAAPDTLFGGPTIRRAFGGQ